MSNPPRLLSEPLSKTEVLEQPHLINSGAFFCGPPQKNRAIRSNSPPLRAGEFRFYPLRSRSANVYPETADLPLDIPSPP
jgi:hypothetical protein